ncbi:MAG TPA: response regulator [Bryobacteraceae bacterium]|nr:response regulator [Bryobacteraceae bacterium]
MAEPLVVAVDDDIRVRESIARLVRSARHAVLMFPSSEALLSSEALGRADCLITDVRMPGIDGLELQRRAKAAYPELPVIFISAHGDEEVRRHALAAGAVAFLYKPFDGEDLLHAIQSALRQEPDS